MNLTTNYGLGKPLPGENYDIAVANNNADLIDAAIKARQNEIATLNARFASKVTVPRCKLQQTGTQSTATGTSEQLLLGAATTVYDTDTMASSKATNEVTIKTAGWYVIGAHICWSSNTAGDRIMTVTKNGPNMWDHSIKAPGAGPAYNAFVVEPTLFAVNDKITWTIYQNSGGTLTTTTGNGGYSWVSVTWYAQ